MKNQFLNIGILSPSEIYLAPLIHLPIFLSEAKINHIVSIRKRILDLGEFIYTNAIDCVCWFLIQLIYA